MRQSPKSSIIPTLVMLSMLFAPVQAFSTQRYEYDALGRLTKVTYDNGFSITYTHDKAGNLVKREAQEAGSNNPPSIPELVSPTDGQTGLPTTLTFEWKQSTDPDGDPVTYDIYNCPDLNTLHNCASVEVASVVNPGESLFYAKLGNSKSGTAPLGYATALILFGIILAVCVRSRKRLSLLMVMAGLTGSFLISCRQTNKTYTASNLTPTTQYYWTVVAKDGKGAETVSEVRSFTTQ